MMVYDDAATSIYDWEFPTVVQELLPSFPAASWILGISSDDSPLLLLQVRHVFVLLWVYGFCGLSMLSLSRVFQHLRFQSQQTPNFAKLLWSAVSNNLVFQPDCAKLLWSSLSNDAAKLWWSAVSKLLLGPILLAAVSVTYLQPLSSSGGIRYPSLCLGLVFCIITIKMVVLGMARMAYASLQLDMLPMMIGMIMASHSYNSSTSTSTSTMDLLFPLMTVGYLVRLLWWTRTAIFQLCHKLQIQAFRLTTTSTTTSTST
jgi:hypothetical protein